MRSRPGQLSMGQRGYRTWTGRDWLSARRWMTYSRASSWQLAGCGAGRGVEALRSWSASARALSDGTSEPAISEPFQYSQIEAAVIWAVGLPIGPSAGCRAV